MSLFSPRFRQNSRLMGITLRAALAFTTVLCTSVAHASPTGDDHGGGGGAGSETVTVVLFLVFVGGAYVIAQFIPILQRRFLIVSGFEYLLFGMLLGPAVPAIEVLDDISPVMPVIALAAGWIGLLRGMEVDLQRLRHRPQGTLRIVVLHHLAAGLAIGATAWWFFTSGWGELFWVDEGIPAVLPWRELAACAVVLGCCAAADSAEPFDVLSRRYEIEGPLTARLRGAARLGDVIVILVFGLVFAIFHPPDEGSTRDLVPTEWAAIQVAIGVGLGLLFTPFLGGRESANGRFLALVGIITFAAGAAYFLRLSPLFVNVVLGMVLVNIARTGRLMQQTLSSTDRPLTLVLYVLAGALWRPVAPYTTFVIFLGFVIIRLVAKALASRVAAWGLEDMRKDLYRGFLAHGEVTVAMAVSFQVVFDGPIVDMTYTVILGSVMLHDVLSPRVLRALLVDAGDVRRERVEAEA